MSSSITFDAIATPTDLMYLTFKKSKEFVKNPSPSMYMISPIEKFHDECFIVPLDT